jgi:hypothetical protein
MRATYRPSSAHEINAASQHLGTPRPRDFGSTGEVAPSGMPERLVEPVEGPNAMSRADELAFNEEVLTVVVHTTSDQNADPFPTFWVNGEKAICFRGVERQVKRKFVERMARSRINNVRQRYYVDATRKPRHQQRGPGLAHVPLRGAA